MPNSPDTDKDPQRGTISRWRLERTIGLEHVFSTILLLMVVVAAWYDNSEKVSILDLRYAELNGRVVRILERQQDTDDSQDDSLSDFRTDMRDSSSTLNAKVDRLLEFHMKSNGDE
jgi:hypothetical protein